MKLGKQTLIDNDYWESGEWKQPPVKIKHGDLVDIRHEDYPVPLIGRYIGKGYGVVELYHYSKETKVVPLLFVSTPSSLW